jgi:hypothetical protein
MTLRPSSVFASLCLALLGCSGQTVATQPGTDGAAGAGGANGADARGTDGRGLLPPVPIIDNPETVGASPVKCGGRPAADPAIVRACVLGTSCSPFPPSFSVSDCIDNALPASGVLPDCAVGAQNCAEMNACLGVGFYADACPALDFRLRCVGTKVLYCRFVRYYRDCAKSGATCTEYRSMMDGEIDAADCTVASVCSTSSDVYVCDGTKRVRCQQGLAFGEDCAARGMTCVAGAAGAVCAKRPASCDQPGASSCDAAGNGSYCDDDGRAFRFDCARQGLKCRQVPDRDLGVECADTTCSIDDASKCFEECDGPLAHLCLGGQRFSVDCHAYGLQRCILDTSPGAGDRARCGYD